MKTPTYNNMCSWAYDIDVYSTVVFIQYSMLDMPFFLARLLRVELCICNFYSLTYKLREIFAESLLLIYWLKYEICLQLTISNWLKLIEWQWQTSTNWVKHKEWNWLTEND